MHNYRKTIAILTFGALLCAVCLALSGCRLLRPGDIEKLDAAYEIWWTDYTNRMAQAGGTVEQPPQTGGNTGGNTGGVVEVRDAVDFASLKWRYGGFNGSGARLDSPRISGLRSDGRVLHYKWDVGLSGWGLGHGDPGAICAVFFERNGEWIGGKFDWVSTSRSNRELKHVETYNNWPTAGISLPWRGRVAFVVVDKSGKRRSNVVEAK